MNYMMTAPCPECPYLKGSSFTWRSLCAHASGEFACHMACKLDDEGTYRARSNKTPHCAGALIFLEQQGRPHQMMRICKRLGLYDHRKLDLTASVVERPKDCERD